MGDSQSTLGTVAPEQSANQTSSEPAEVITLQTCSENVEIIRGRVGDRPAWHVILVPLEKEPAFKQMRTESWIQIDDFGRNIRYRDRAGTMRQASGYGTGPTEQLMKWINENYDPRAIDENTLLTYTSDDLRFCTIERAVFAEILGIFLNYHRHARFHYIKLSNDYKSRLILRTGIKSFDRVIEFNGANIERDSADDLKKKLDNSSDTLFQLLVCSPATYAHYKSNKKRLHSHLDTVQRLKPVHGIANNNYQIVQTENSLACITLVNSIHTMGNNLGNTQFTTAHESVAFDTVEDNHASVSRKDGVGEQGLSNRTKNDDDCERKEHKTQRLMEQLTSLLVDNRNNANNAPEIHRIQCYGCGSPRIYDDRYKCLECHKYDLCGMCFDQRRETLKHISAHVMVHFSDHNEIFGERVDNINTTVTLRKFKEKYSREEHANVKCNHCGMLPIKGLRFKCDSCLDYDLCINCMEQRVHDQTHPLLAMGKSRFPEISMNDIELKEELGRGGFGTVYKAKWLSKDRSVACKVIDAKPEHKHHEASFRKELAAYAELSGPYILKTYGYNIQQLSNGTRRCMLVMEFMPRSSLASVLQRKDKISLRKKLEMASQIASGMRKLHAHRMIHRDIRPDNILVTDDYTAKIGDMGLARVWLPDVKLTTIGCLPYMPLDFYTGEYDQSLDVYTYGLTINELFTEKIHKFDFASRRAELTSHSPIFADLIDRCIHKDARQRPTAIEIETILRMYRQAIEKYIRENNIKYTAMPVEEKNSMFITVYHILQLELDEVLKTKFPSSNSAGELVNSTNGAETESVQLLRLLDLLGVR